MLHNEEVPTMGKINATVESELQALFTTFTRAAAEVIKKHSEPPPPLETHYNPPQAPVEAKPQAPKPAPKPRKPAPKQRAHRRNDVQMAQQALLVAAAVHQHPKGIRIGDLMDELHTSHQITATSLRIAAEKGLIRKEGVRRGTKYYPGFQVNNHHGVS